MSRFECFKFASLWCIALLAGCASGPAPLKLPPGSAQGTSQAARDRGATAPMVATANPLATKAGLQMLAQGGTAVDAAIAAQLVLGLVEPQSSGLGGGLLMLHWDESRQRLTSIDGLAAAPGRTTASLRTDVDGRLLPGDASQRGGRTVGVPGALSALMLAHRQHGRLDWAALVAPAREAATQGFPMPAYLHAVLSSPEALRDLRSTFALYFDAQGQVLPVGTMIRHPAYAQTMQDIALKGPQRWWDERATTGLLDAARQGFRPSLMTREDLSAYRAVEREPVCGPFLAYKVCTAAPPSFGGIAVLQILQMVQARAQGRHDFQDPAFVHLYAEAGKLAQADRRLHVGDPDHVAVPTSGLVAPLYLSDRARLIDMERAAARPAAGQLSAEARTSKDPAHFEAASLAGNTLSLVPDEHSVVHAQTSQLAVVDARGHIVSMTTTNNLNFGARLAFDGVVLNNAMTNFSEAPRSGERLANQMAPRKRPVTSMAPTIAFDAAGRPLLAGGAAGGGPIVDYVAAGLIHLLALGHTPAQTVAAPHVTTATPGVLQLEKSRGMEEMAVSLRARGHTVEMANLNSGQVFIRRSDMGWTGAADPRRDGTAESGPVK